MKKLKVVDYHNDNIIDLPEAQAKAFVKGNPRFGWPRDVNQNDVPDEMKSVLDAAIAFNKGEEPVHKVEKVNTPEIKEEIIEEVEELPTLQDAFVAIAEEPTNGSAKQDLEEKTDEELRELAKELGVKLGKTKNREKIISKILNH